METMKLLCIFLAYFCSSCLTLVYTNASVVNLSCIQAMDAGMDYGLKSAILKKYSKSKLPSIKVSGVTMSRGRMQVGHLERACHVKTQKQSSGRIIINVCVLVRQMRLSFVAKKWFFKIPGVATMTGTRVNARVSGLLKTGQSPKLEKFKIIRLGKIKVKFSGSSSILNPLTNWIMSSKFRNKIKTEIEKSVMMTARNLLPKVKLP